MGVPIQFFALIRAKVSACNKNRSSFKLFTSSAFTSKIVVDVFGATNNSNWIIQMGNAKEIKNVYYEQVEDEVLRVTIELKHPQHWGHQLYYKGNNLVIRVRRQPESLELRNLRIAIDAGHGGGNTGTYGPIGSSEKELALTVALKLRQALRLQGAKVLMTRTTETFVDTDRGSTG